MKKEIKPYFIDKLFLRLLKASDLEYTLQWRNKKEHRIWFTNSNIISKEEHLSWFNQYQANDNDYVFIVSDSNYNRIGQISIYDINWSNKIARFGRYLVNPSYSGLGFMKKAAKLSILLAKNQLLIQQLILEVKISNEKAIHIYKHCGFKIIMKENGHLRMALNLNY